MEHISNKEKAKEIAKCCSVMPPTTITQSDVIAMTNNAAMQAIEWKDEEHTKEKQQWIDKAAEWLRMTMDFFNNGEFNTEKFVNDFIQEMKGE